jgi:hypothetical protein
MVLCSCLWFCVAIYGFVRKPDWLDTGIVSPAHSKTVMSGIIQFQSAHCNANGTAFLIHSKKKVVD